MLHSMQNMVIVFIWFSIYFSDGRLLVSTARVGGEAGESKMTELWADKVKGFSSQYDTYRYDAYKATGEADVYPLYGDLINTWTQDKTRRNNRQYIEVGFPQALFLRQVDIYETFGAGGVRKLSALTHGNTWKTLYHNDTVIRLLYSRIFSPRITFPLCLVDTLRIDVDCTAGGTNNFVEIDAIKIHGLTSSQCVLEGQQGSCCCGPCYNNNHCNLTSYVCPKTDDNPRCSAGYKGDTCNQDCDEENYGEGCRQVCGNCAGGRTTCLKVSGDCPMINPRCDLGFTGIRCDEACPPGEYGADCTEQCGQCAEGPDACSTTTGECPGQPPCSAGYTGKLCRTECENGTFGNNCTDTCGHCADGRDVCARDSGICPVDPSGSQCSSGYSGQLCKQPCPPGEYGADCTEQCGQCAEGPDACSTTTGECSGQPPCSAGYTGKLCKTECENGTFGNNCTDTCGHCADGRDVCTRDSGICPVDPSGSQCSSGYSGQLCKQQCSSGKHGADCKDECGHCAGGPAACLPTTGLCSGSPACAPGYKGDDCKVDCPPGKYGASCTEQCPDNCAAGPMACSPTSGACLGSPACMPGVKGIQCGSNCSSGEHGADCMEECGHCAGGPAACLSTSGVCSGSPACVPGYTGDDCKVESTPQSQDPDLDSIIGGVAAAVIVIILVGVGVFFLIKRRRNSKKGSRESANDFHAVADAHQDRDISTREPRGTDRETEYHNVVAFHVCVSAIPLDELEEHVRAKRAADEIGSEYENLPKGLQATTEVAKKPQNKGKSRYQNIVAYDHSRVVLDAIDNDPDSDYINACYIHGYKEKNKYVASQGPTPVIIDDFWRTIWQVDTGTIVMLTSLIEDTKVKSVLYWPNSVSETAVFGLIRVTLLAEDVYADFTVRIFHVTNKKYVEQAKKITQFHFTSWPDHGVPTQATGLLNFRDKVNANNTNLSGPLFVHCSAGIGRTGTFIGLDYLIKQANEDGVVDVPTCVRLMRQQRTNMIQTEAQYEFLYDALIEALALSSCSIPSTVFASMYREICRADPDTEQTNLQKQFEVLKDIPPALKKNDVKAGLDPINKHKNRSMNILAADSARPFLSTPVPGANDYINAVFIPAYKRKRGFIVTQMPLPGTVIDFWRLIHEQDVHTVIMLNTMNGTMKDYGIYWPDNSGQYGPFDVETLEENDGEFYKTRILQLKYKKEIPINQDNIKQFQCTFWPDDETFPGSSGPLITLIEEVERWQQKNGNGPIVVHCLDGATKSGLYCAVSSIIERLKVDQEVNILQTLKQMRTNRPEIVRNLDQFQFIHEVVLAYLESFQTYANFQ